MDAAPESTTIALSARLDSIDGSVTANATFFKWVPHPVDRRRLDPGVAIRDSPMLLRARLGHGAVRRGVSCEVEACAIGGCLRSQVPWGSRDRCDLFVFNEAAVDCPAPPFDFYASVCTNELLKSALKPPFSIACVVPSPSSLAARACSLSTSTFGHGSLVLSCEAGSCLTLAVEPDGAELVSALTKPAQDAKYAAMFLLPLIVTIVLVLGATRLDERRRGERLALISKTVHHGENVDEVTIATQGLAAKVADSPAEDVDDVGAVDLDATGIRAADENRRIARFALRSIGLVVPLGSGGLRSCRSGAANKDVTILDSVSLHCGGDSGMLALIGASGSGKTSLLDVLAGRKTTGRVFGQVVCDGRVITRFAELRRLVAYVLQADDVVPKTSSVREHLLFHAYLRLGHVEDVVARISRVNTLVAEIGLEKCLDTALGSLSSRGISGGERRRVSLAVELLNPEAKLVLADEPTSGLDSLSALHVATALRRVSRTRGVVASIHAPSPRLLGLFTRVAVLTPLGRLAYCGPLSGLQDFLGVIGHGEAISANEEASIADFFIETLASDPAVAQAAVIEYAASRWFGSECEVIEAISREIPPASTNPTNLIQPENVVTAWVREVGALSGRFTRNLRRHPVLAGVHLVATALVAVVATLLYFQVTDDLGGAINRAGFFFFAHMYFVLSASADLGVFQDEKPLFMRERASGLYSSSSFAFAKFVWELIPLRLFPTVLATFIVVNGVGLVPGTNELAVVWGAFFFASLTSSLAFLAIGAAFDSVGVANFVAMVFALLTLTLSGFMLIDFGYVTSGDVASSDDLGALATAGLTSSPTPSGVVAAGAEVRWIPYLLGYLSYLRPNFELLMVNELDPLVFQIRLRGESEVSSQKIPLTGSTILAQLGLDRERAARDWGLVVMWTVVYFVLWLTMLETRARERR